MNAPKKARNSFGIPFLRTGPANLISVINQIIAALDAVRARPSADIDPLVTDDGTLLTLRNSQTGSTQSRLVPPWTIYIVSSETDLRVSVAPGMVNNFIPTIGGASLVAVPAPALTVSGASGTIYLDATVDAAGNITALIIANATAIPADTSTQKRKLIGMWTASGGAFTNVASVLNANQTLYLCNGTAIWEA